MKKVLSIVCAVVVSASNLVGVYAEDGDGTVTNVAQDHQAQADEIAFEAKDASEIDGYSGNEEQVYFASADLDSLSSVGVSWQWQDGENSSDIPDYQIRYYQNDAWSDWIVLDAQSEESEGISDPYYVGNASKVEAVLVPHENFDTFEASFTIVDSGYSQSSQKPRRLMRAAARKSATSIQIHTREEWFAAGNPVMEWEPDRSANWQGAVVHHTVTGNNYSQAEVPAIINSMYIYHNVHNGWGDIGYNLLVDRFGGIWEGRDEGVDNTVVQASEVIGAHTGSFNQATFGVSLIGSYNGDTAPTDAQIDSAASAIAWEFYGLGITSAYGTFEYHGTQQRITGHGDSSHWYDGRNRTACPGSQVNARMDEIRAKVEQKLIAMRVTGWDTSTATPHYDDIQWLIDTGISTGWPDLTFRPMDTVKRQDMAAFLRREAIRLGVQGADTWKPSDEDWNRFTDVDQNTPHAEDILWLASENIAVGYPDGTYRGMEPVYRQDMAAFLHQLAAIANIQKTGTMTFRDVTKDTPHAEDISWLGGTGISTGYPDGTYQGMTPVYRQDMAAFIHRLDNLKNA